MICALFKKEMRLQRSNLYLAAGIALFWLVLLGLSFKSGLILSLGIDVTMGTFVQILHIIVVGGTLLMLLPLMIGASCVAQERQMGVLESQLSLPVSRRAQWTVKVAVALGLSLLAGGGLFIADVPCAFRRM